MEPLLIISLLVVLLLIPTAYAGYIGAPYAPTKTATIRQAYQHIKLGPQDLLVDLGAGDGRALLLAADFNARARGYELSPIMWFVTWLRLKLNRVSTAKLSFGNFYRRSLPPETTVIFVFLMPKIMPRVLAYLRRQNLPRCRAVLVYAFPFPDLSAQHAIRQPRALPLYIYDYKELTYPATKTTS